jgi:hypothetical protein
MKKILLLALLPGLTALAQGPLPPGAAHAETARTEGAVAGGLRWLADHQIHEGAQAGSWPVGTANYRPAIASLAGLAFLANGHLPGDDGPYGKTVAEALKYVMGSMAPDGYIGQGDRSGMYIHAIGSLFALSCFGMQSDEKFEPKLAEWCRRSLDVIIRAQKIARAAEDQGGWRYDPYTPESDVSVTCWQLLVLHTARQAGFEVDPQVINAAQAYLNRAYVPVKPEAGQDKGAPAGGYLYRPGIDRQPSHSSSALVVFILSLYDAADEQRTREALTYLRRYTPTWGGPQYSGFFYFSSFYMAQGMFQVGGQEWDAFGPRMANLLLEHQSGDGSWPYPPDNASPANLQGTGPAYPVAMAVLMLSLDKQFLPMYQRQRRLYDSGSSVVTPAAKPVVKDVAAATPTAGPISAATTPEAVPELVPEVTAEVWRGTEEGKASQADEAGEADEEEGVSPRAVGGRMDGF